MVEDDLVWCLNIGSVLRWVRLEAKSRVMKTAFPVVDKEFIQVSVDQTEYKDDSKDDEYQQEK